MLLKPRLTIVPCHFPTVPMFSQPPLPYFLKGLLSASFISGSLLLSPVATAERVIDVTPSINSQDVLPSTSISGVFENDDQGTVDAQTVRIYLNDRDITSASTVTQNFFSYRPEKALPQGNYNVRVDYVTTQGLSRSVGWGFTVSPQILAQVESVTHNANEPLKAGATLTAIVKGTPRSQVSVLFIENGRTLQSLPAEEIYPGVYIASLTVSANSSVQEGIVVGRLERGGQTTYGIASTPVALQGQTTTSSGTTLEPTTTSPTSPAAAAPKAPAATNAAPIKPTLTSPAVDKRIDTSGFTLTGETSPGATVRIRVEADTPLLGNVFSLGGERLVDTEIQADSTGAFEVKVPAPTILKRDTRYKVTMEASQNGKTTAPVEAEFKQR